MLGARSRNPGSGNACWGKKQIHGGIRGWESTPIPCWRAAGSQQAPHCSILAVWDPFCAQSRSGRDLGAGRAPGTHVVEQGLLGVLPKFLVQHLLENPHPGRHQQGKGEGSNTWKGSTVLQLQLTKFGFQGKKNQTNCPDLVRKLITILGFDYRYPRDPLKIPEMHFVPLLIIINPRFPKEPPTEPGRR